MVARPNRTTTTRTNKTGSELFIVDNSDADWKVLRYLHEWCQLSRAIDIATGYFEIGALLGLKDEWQKVDSIRILMGDEVSLRTRAAFADGLARIRAAWTPAWRPRNARTTSSSPSRRSSRPFARAKSRAAFTARRSSTPRPTSPTPASKSSAPWA